MTVEELAKVTTDEVTKKIDEKVTAETNQIREDIVKQMSDIKVNIDSMREDIKKEFVQSKKNANPFENKSYININEVTNKDKHLIKTLLACFDAESEKQGKSGVSFLDTENKSIFPKNESINNKLASAFGEQYLEKTLQVNNAGSGGYLVTPQVASEVIPYLAAQESFYNEIPTIVMESGHLQIIKETNEPTIYIRNELQSYNDSVLNLNDININTRRVVGSITMTNQMLRYNTIANIDTWVTSKLMRPMITTLEKQFLKGNGIGANMIGMYANATKANSAGKTVANVFTDLGWLLESVEGANVMIDNGCFAMTSRSFNYLKHLYDAGIKARPFADDLAQNRLEGYKAFKTNIISNTINTDKSEVYFFDAAKTIKGISKNMTVNIRPFGMFKDSAGVDQNGAILDTTTIDVSMEVDFGIFYNEAAAVLEAVAWKA